MKKPFFGLTRPKLAYSGIDDTGPDIQEIPVPERIFFSRQIKKGEGPTISRGQEVRTGQRLRPLEDMRVCVTATATGVIGDVSVETDYSGRTTLSMSIETEPKDRWDPEFEQAGISAQSEDVLSYLSALPGISDLIPLVRRENPLDTILVSGFDRDLLTATNQLSLKTGAGNLARGIEIMKQMTGVNRVMVAAPPSLASEAERGGVEVRIQNPLYPGADPRLLVRSILGTTVLPSRPLTDVNVGVVSAEGVIAMGRAFQDQRPPVSKLLTVIGKDNRPVAVRARIGTPVGHLLNTLHIEVSGGDRLVLGGPMAGKGIYSVDVPIGPDTDAVMVQDKDHVIPPSSEPCINCGECVRACPARVPVNMLIRLLENGLYEEAAQQYDLLSCIECGLCSYVCMMRIPIFHYIMLGKHELALSGYLEESHG